MSIHSKHVLCSLALIALATHNFTFSMARKIKTPDEELLAAVHCESFSIASEKITHAIEHGADINAQDKEGRTPLIKTVVNEP